MNKLDKQIEKILDNHLSYDTGMYRILLIKTMVSQIKQSILKAIMELHKRKCGEEGFELGYLRLEDLKELLQTK